MVMTYDDGSRYERSRTRDDLPKRVDPDDMLEDLAGCYAELGLPTRLADFGVNDPTAAELDVLVDGALGSPSVRRFERQVTADDLSGAIAAVEQRFR